MSFHDDGDWIYEGWPGVKKFLSTIAIGGMIVVVIPMIIGTILGLLWKVLSHHA